MATGAILRSARSAALPFTLGPQTANQATSDFVLALYVNAWTSSPTHTLGIGQPFHGLTILEIWLSTTLNKGVPLVCGLEVDALNDHGSAVDDHDQHGRMMLPQSSRHCDSAVTKSWVALTRLE